MKRLTIFTLLYLSTILLASNLFASYSMTHQHDNGKERTETGFAVYVPHEHIFTSTQLTDEKCRKVQKTGKQRKASDPGTTGNPNFETVTVWIYHDAASCANILHDGKTHDDVWTLDSARGRAYLNNRQSNNAIRLGHPDPHHPDTESPDVDESENVNDPYRNLSTQQRKQIECLQWIDEGHSVCTFSSDHYSPICCAMKKEAETPSAPKAPRKTKLTLTWGAIKKGTP